MAFKEPNLKEVRRYQKFLLKQQKVLIGLNNDLYLGDYNPVKTLKLFLQQRCGELEYKLNLLDRLYPKENMRYVSITKR
jgi:hypothetical protein